MLRVSAYLHHQFQLSRGLLKGETHPESCSEGHFTAVVNILSVLSADFTIYKKSVTLNQGLV